MLFRSGTLARCAAEGIETYLVTATRGERGRFGDAAEKPAPEVVGMVREAELKAAAKELGVREVAILGYPDGGLDACDPLEVQTEIAGHIRRVRPQVVVTFGPEGAYGHPDHIAICQMATAAVVCAADPDCGGPGHRVSKLYYMAWRKEKWDAYQAALRTLRVMVDGVERLAAPWPDWAVTTVVETNDLWPAVWRAVSCHKTQMAIYKTLEHLPGEQHRAIWGSQEYYRVFSAVNGGRKIETDLFEGLR